MSAPSFTPLFDWALLPEKCEDKKPDKGTFEDFVWLSRERVPQHCKPWELGAKITWNILSPVDLNLTPAEDVELKKDTPEKDLIKFSAINPSMDLWRRDDCIIACSKELWLNYFIFDTGNGRENMFLPNGYSTFEWRLGFTIEHTQKLSAFVMPFDIAAGVGTEAALLAPSNLASLNGHAGFSVALSVRGQCQIRRGDVIGKMLFLSPDAIKANLSV